MNKKVIIIGAGGHAKVIADIILKSGDEVLGFLDDNKEKGTKIFLEYGVLGKVEDCINFAKEDAGIQFIIGIGNNYVRKAIFEKYSLNYYTAIHPSAIIASDVSIGEGTVVMPGAIINASATIGKCAIVNTLAIVEHDNVLGDFVHISPNATLCGTVKIGELTHVGAGVTVRNNISITSECTIGAGAVVVRDIEEKGTYVGVPAKKIK